MSLIVNTNVGSLNAQRSLAASGAELKTAMERLSSGKKINSAADDAAGFAIAERMTAQIRGLNMATRNANDGLSLLAVIENASNEVTNMLQRMRELAVQATNDTNSLEDRKFLQEEVAGLIKEIDRVATQTQYNGQAILDEGKILQFQVGTEAGQSASLRTYSMGTQYNFGNAIGFVEGGPWSTTSNVFELHLDHDDFAINDYVVIGSSTGDNYSSTRLIVDVEDLGATQKIILDDGVGQLVEPGGVVVRVATRDPETGAVTPDGGKDSLFNLNIETSPSESLNVINRSIDWLSNVRASYGAMQNRLEYTVSNLMNVSEFTTAARSRIEDADFAIESARLAKAQLLQQAGTAMLAQANAQPQLALSLIS
jgi:flagellin